MTAHIDPIARAHLEAQAAVRTFLPSMAGQPVQPPKPVPPSLMAPSNSVQEAIRAASMARHVESQSARLARGLPPQEQQQPTPEEHFGNNLDIVHTRAIAHAIAQVPEADRGKFISEAHDSATKWIASHNGKVIVHGKVQIAGGPESAEKLAAKIVNDTVEDHDQRKQAEAEAAANPGGDTGASGAGTSENRTGRPDSVGPAGGTGQNQGDAPPGGQTPSARPGIGTGDGGPSPAITPQIVPPGGDGQIVDPGPPPQVSPEERAQVGQPNAAGEQVTQPKDSLEQNRALAMDAAPEFHQALSTLTSGIPGLKYDKLRPQKDIERAKDKLDDANAPNTLSDYLGAQIAADSPKAKDQLIDALQRHFPTIEVDDHFLTGKQDKAHYPSANVQVQLGNGSTAEIQIVPKEVQDTNDQSHVFYKVGREAEENGDTAERDKQWAQAAQIHDAQLEKFKARNGLGPQVAAQTSQGVNPIGDPIQIGRHTFVRVASPAQPAASPLPGNGGPSQSPQPAQSPTADPAPQDSAPTDQPESRTPSPDPSPNSTPSAQPIAKGSRVTLKDGSQADVLYVHPNLPIARVRVGGRMQEINTDEDIDGQET